jgi:spore coat protein CotF
MENLYSEKEILADALSAQKTAANLYNTASFECVHDDLRDAVNRCLEQEHSIQVDVFNEMHKRGFYPTPEAEQEKINQTKQTFSQCANC